MQSMKVLTHWLQQNANDRCYLFSLQDLRGLCLNLSDSAFKTLLSRTVNAGHLERVCRGLYLYKKATLSDGLLLFHAAVNLRSHEFNYISLETVLSDAGVISQIPMNWITLMSSGRKNIISCGKFGTIEFIHTNQKPTDVMNLLSYDTHCGLWRAHVALALKDMKTTHRNCDLINWDAVHELI